MPDERSRLGWDQDKPLRRDESADCRGGGSTGCRNVVSWPDNQPQGTSGPENPGEISELSLRCAERHEERYWAIADPVGWERQSPLDAMQATRCKWRSDEHALCVENVVYTAKRIKGLDTVEGDPKAGALRVALTCSDDHTDWYYGVRPDA